MRKYLFAFWVGIIFSGLTTSLSWGQNHVQPSYAITEAQEIIHLRNYLWVLPDSNHALSFDEIRDNPTLLFSPLDTSALPLSPDPTYWGKLRIHNQFPYPTRWILRIYNAGEVDIQIADAEGIRYEGKSGRYIPDAEKADPTGHTAHFPLEMAAGDSLMIFMRIKEVDHTPLDLYVNVYDRAYWYSTQRDPDKDTVLFFTGIFAIMILYNFLLYFTLRVPAYLYYALYLVCIAGFVSFAVGPMRSPPFGNPVLLAPLGHLAFSLINVFYLQFGRSFLDTADLIPRWDTFLKWYIAFKIVVIIGVQVMLYTWFHYDFALDIEFSLMFLEVLISIVLFIVLLRKGDILAQFFVAGSSAVIVFGLTLAVLGHLFRIPYSFVIFLSSIVVEMIFFSLGLGYRIRRARELQLKAQEALNRELSKVNSAFGRFVPHEFLRSLGRDTILDVQLGDQVEEEVTVFFSDVRGYTTLSEGMTPKENFDFLNAYLGRMGPIIQQNDGFVNQYYGDGIMALFMNSPEDAIRASIKMQIELRVYNEARAQKGRAPIKIGIGLHSGPLMMGVIGDTLRLEAGVVADTVNTASRMEGLTKYYQSQILASEDSLKKMTSLDDFQYRFLGKVLVKGKKAPIEVYEFFEGDSPELIILKQKTLAAFQQGVAAYFQQDFAAAAKAFDEVLAVNPNDVSAERYKQEAMEYLLEGVEEGWSGVVRF